MLGLPIDITFCSSTYYPSACKYLIGFIIGITIIVIVYKIFTPRHKKM